MLVKAGDAASDFCDPGSEIGDVGISFFVVPCPKGNYKVHKNVWLEHLARSTHFKITLHKKETLLLHNS